MEKYSGQKLSVGELKLVTKQVSDYYRRHGYPVATAFLPRQEIVDGIVEIKVLPGVLDQVVLKNNSGLKDSFVQGFMQDLHSGMQMDGDILSRSLNNLNGLPGIRARGILEPGTKVGSSSLTVILAAAPAIEGAVYTDNSGGKYSGRYRYGGQIVVNEPFKNGDRFVAGGLLSNENMRNYNFGYEMAVNKSGGRLGISCAESDYELGDYFAQAGAVGTAKTASIYGSQPLGGGQLRLIYGYEHNRLNDELRIFDYAARKSSDVFHLGLTGSVNSAAGYTGYSAVWRAGNLKLRSAEALAADAFNDTEGGFSKINFDVNHVTNLGRLTQFYLFAHGQMASRNLDSSEQFYLGGADAVRAYPQGEAGGDSGYQATAELRYQMPVKGLSLALFADVGEVLTRKDGETADPHRRLAGWGIGAVYSRSRSVYARLDYARKIKGEPYRSEAEDGNGRLWFRLYKLF
ncbi:ShlB/FhaC/HecB family hemolysin secretion/activation protein [Phascolarctobacterium sp.]